jgi:hypothetical protein
MRVAQPKALRDLGLHRHPISASAIPAISDKKRQAGASILCIQILFQPRKSAPTIHGECNMKMLVTKMLASSVLLATLVAAETAYAQTPYGRDAHRDGAPATANDSWETGVAGARVRVQPDDAIEDGRVVGQDPDPNIRSQLQREYKEGGDGD